MPASTSSIGRRSVLGLLGSAALPGVAAIAAPSAPVASERHWFIQVWFDTNAPVETNPGSDPGRVEISMGGAFVACALAPVYRSRENEILLVPLSMGATATGVRDNIRIEVYGELKRLLRPTIKITEVSPKA